MFNLYLHEFSRSDDDRALHDHPWLFNLSVLLSGTYVEHTIDAGGIHPGRVSGSQHHDARGARDTRWRDVQRRFPRLRAGCRDEARRGRRQRGPCSRRRRGGRWGDSLTFAFQELLRCEGGLFEGFSEPGFDGAERVVWAIAEGRDVPYSDDVFRDVESVERCQTRS